MTIKEYWNLIGWEPFFTITWEPDFPQAFSFRKMLMNHNFCFTKIPDRINDMPFLKSPKTLFLDHFWPFLPDGDFFQKNPTLSHTAIYGPLTPSFRKNYWANSKKTYGQTEGRMDRPYFIRPFRPRPRVQKTTNQTNSALRHVRTDFWSMMNEECLNSFMTEALIIEKPVH